MSSSLYFIAVIAGTLTVISSALTKQETSDSDTGRTLFYDDHQVFFTMMVYFPFIVNQWSYGIPFTSVNQLLRGASELIGPNENIVVEGVNKTMEKQDNQEKSNQILEFTKRAYSSDSAGNLRLHNISSASRKQSMTLKSRRKRTLYIDDQVINILVCLSLPFSVPLLRYDQDLHQAYKNKYARLEFEKNLPQVPTHDGEFESAYNDEATYGDFDEEDNSPHEDN